MCQSVTFGVGGGLGEGGLGEAGGASSDGRGGARPMMLLAVTSEPLRVSTESLALVNLVKSMASSLLAKRSVKAGSLVSMVSSPP